MARPAPFIILFPESLKDDLRHLDRKWHGTIRDSIIEQLQFTPDVETRNRKRLRTPIDAAQWELRCGPDNRFRVLYNRRVETHEVQIVAIGEKRNNELWVRGVKVYP